MRYRVITIEREYASGGSETGEKLSEKLGIPCYGHEILEQAAVKLDMPPERLLEIEEKMTGSFLYGLTAFATFTSGADTDILTLEHRLTAAEAEVIKNFSVSPCIIVGRGGAAILKDKPNVLKVFIHADKNTRTDRAVNIYGIDPKQAESVLHRFDKRRANYFKAATNSGWKDADMYHMFLNSGKFSIDTIVDIIYSAVN